MKIIDSDEFVSMPLSTQALYFHLSMRADDEGFINKYRNIMRMIGSNEDELKLLIAKRFILTFESGIIVIKHWKIHNYIRKDRLSETTHINERNLLNTKENGVYTFECQPSDGQVTDKCQHSIGKDRLVEDSKVKDNNTSKTTFDKFIKELEKSFIENKIATFKSKINKTKSTKEAFSKVYYSYIDIEYLIDKFVSYVIRNKNLAVRLDKFLIAYHEGNLKDIEYAKNNSSSKEPEPGSAAYYEKMNENLIDTEVIK